MVKRLYEYSLPLKNGLQRKGLIAEEDGRFGEIAPLDGFSKESFNEAKKEALEWAYENKSPTLPSVCFGISSLKKVLKSVRLPLCSLGAKEGFSHFKLKLGSLSLKEALDLVREYVGKAKLRLDFNRKWSLEEGIEFCSHFKKEDFEYLEEPVASHHLEEFSNKTGFPIAIDESIFLPWNKVETLKAIVIKPTIIGSIPKVPKRLMSVLSSSYESGLGLVHIAQFGSIKTPVGLDTLSLFEKDLLKNPISIEPGFFSWNASSPLLDTSLLCSL